MTIDYKPYSIDILDTAGPEEYVRLSTANANLLSEILFFKTLSAMREHYMKASHGIYAVYDITSMDSLREMTDQLEGATRMKNSAYPLVIVG